ncbi:MAG: hypothetical protein JGK12_23240 [Microcoleus sp. PH2017_01_SCD_O_A]|uniref:hypothetical protein n=1 Tax=unclassified Microcoleus TaxID=2642155 RepID=UPI001DEB2131|nr:MULTISPECIES: hypothetical protein [unclassified Microcoleus]MCC3420195.1 hypothetical protein [Microcoleus sp. PH2017_07_MST_O_A]MCC3441388.1 hypothetical protein [Microcoleus sp. PH2017_03_ELD_O_A]MCC3467536.1 hypothetical protein [Microcoleus sp. PH2017_06_SFM_O_A]MCC3513307.1 hypothetical protein [Microcoleus sp. PH2017_17_BER_D_A]MCC3426745.1 hypothetical protein [Microcoleus sp. PH2017_01_SCD_O_A]
MVAKSTFFRLTNISIPRSADSEQKCRSPDRPIDSPVREALEDDRTSIDRPSYFKIDR